MASRRTFLIAGSALVGAALVPGVAQAANHYVFADSTGRAINGYDPLAYFTEGKPVEGSPEFVAEWMDASWQFASQENRDLFAADPEKFAPQYGGYCSFAVSRRALIASIPEAWMIFEDKLYLNQSMSVHQLWLEEVEFNIFLAEGNWPKILG